MKQLIVTLYCSSLMFASAQNVSRIKGNILDSFTLQPLKNVTVSVTNQTTVTNALGFFELKDIAEGNYELLCTYENYQKQLFQISIKQNEILDLGTILLEEIITQVEEQQFISLSDVELSTNSEIESTATIGLLTSSKDVFLNVAAYQFSSSFFKPRGYISKDENIMINGISMNKIFNGNPQWSNWGGLNDVIKNQVFSNGIYASDYGFGGLANTSNMLIRASGFSKGGRISYATSNRTYRGRAMFSYFSGLNKKGWAYALSVSKRYANQGFVQGTSYHANSFFLSVEKSINAKHSLNFNAFYTPNIRGKSSANTQEVYDLKSRKYNAFWGDQSEDERSARLKEVNEPIFMLNHFWQENEKLSLNTNIAYQFGKIANSRLDYGGTTLYEDNSGNSYILGGGTNPDPTYYQKLPSYYLRDIQNPDYGGAYLAQDAFQNYGQINWQALYEANSLVREQGGNSVYALYDDINEDHLFVANTIASYTLNEHINFNGKIDYKHLKSKNYAQMKDLLGGSGYLDVDGFSDNLLEAQNNLASPNSIVQVGDKFRYNYEISANTASAFVQSQFSYNKIDFFIATELSNTAYQRDGLYQNGRFLLRSFGESEKLNFLNFGLKGGGVYKITGRHLITANVGYRTLAPTLRNSFSNVRENNDVVYGLAQEKITSVDMGYILRTPFVQGRLTGHYTSFKDATQVTFYYADGLAVLQQDAPVETSAFVQEVMTNIEKRNIGLELGVSVQVLPALKVKSAIAIGEYIYNNNPNLYVTSSSIKEFESNGVVYNEGNRLDFGSAAIKNYHTSNGPQRAYSLGIEYRDPDYWWFGLTGNYFSNAYVSISNIMRTANFSKDYDGLPIHDYDPEIASDLLQQEKFESYLVLNAVGGKSWRLKNNYIGFTLVIGNITNTLYKTGGYEQSRNANYTVLKEDKDREIPVFGSKYWFGYGTTYYLNIYYRF